MEIDKDHGEISIFPILPIEINIRASQSISTSNQYIPSPSPIIINETNVNENNNNDNNNIDYEIIDYEPSPAPSPPYPPIDTLFIQQIQNMRGGRFTSYPTHIIHSWLRSLNQS
eukprot:807541_1